MKKLFALMVVCAALVAVGCGERDTTTPPANDATPAVPGDEDAADEVPADEAPADETGI